MMGAAVAGYFHVLKTFLYVLATIFVILFFFIRQGLVGDEQADKANIIEKQRQEKAEYAAAVQLLQDKYPSLNPNSKLYDEKRAAKIQDWINDYVDSYGGPRGAALMVTTDIIREGPWREYE